jgi:hypothetical protein
VSNLMMVSEARVANRGGPALWLQTASFRYGVSLLAVLVALLMQVTLEDILRDQSIYLLFVPAVLIAGGVGGFGPGPRHHRTEYGGTGGGPLGRHASD